MENAADKDSHVERIGPEGLQVSSRAGSLAGYAQRVLHPERSAGQLTGVPSPCKALGHAGTASVQALPLVLLASPPQAHVAALS